MANFVPASDWEWGNLYKLSSSPCVSEFTYNSFEAYPAATGECGNNLYKLSSGPCTAELAFQLRSGPCADSRLGDGLNSSYNYRIVTHRSGEGMHCRYRAWNIFTVNFVRLKKLGKIPSGF